MTEGQMLTISPSTSATTTIAGDVALAPGGTWSSWEQFRVSGSSGLVNHVADGQVGFLTVRGLDFAILRRRDFDHLYGLARDALRLMRGMPLLRSGAELILRSRGDEATIRHFQELTLTFPELVTAPTPKFDPIELEDETADLEGVDVGSIDFRRARTRRHEDE